MNVHHPMTTWTIKSRTDDSDLALDILDGLQYKGYSAWIEDENGNAVDEKSLERTKPIRCTFRERVMGPVVVVASIIAGIIVLVLVGLWVD
jgi:hypothetical protein